MTDFDDIGYLNNGNPKQKQVYRLLATREILLALSKFDPIVTGTIPIAIDIDTSDVDICCCWKVKAAFINTLTQFANENNFSIQEVMVNGVETVIANFEADGFEIEIFGQNRPVKQQNAYRHMIVEHEILEHRGESFRQEIIRLKQTVTKPSRLLVCCLG